MDFEEKEEKPFVSVVMTVLNVERTIGECLQSLLNLDYPKDRYEIVIVDGMSKDNSRRIIMDFIKKHKRPLIRLYKKKGSIGAGRNEALRFAKGEFIAITDGDMVVDPAWLKELVQSFEEGIAGVGGPNDNADKNPLTKCISSLDIQGPSNDVVPLISPNPYSKGFTTKKDVYASVCRNTCYRRHVLDEVGGFDETLIGAEDPELNMRILKRGYSLRYNPKAVVYHHHRTNLKAFFRQQRLFAVGQAFVNKKHPELFKPIQPMPTIAFTALVAMIALSYYFPVLLYLVIAIVFAYLGLYILYGFKCAWKKEDLRLVLLMPVVVLTWHLAWVVYYPIGLLTR